MPRKLLLIALILVFLAGCANPTMPTYPSTSRDHTAPENATELPMSETPTHLLAAQATISSNLADAQINLQCLEVEPSLPSKVSSGGILILNDQAVYSNGRTRDFDTYFMDMATRTSTQIAKPNEFLANFSVSPDRKWIAYKEGPLETPSGTLNLQLIIATAQHQVYKALPWQKAWGQFKWLDNQHLVIKPEMSNVDKFAALGSTFIVLNPFADERSKILEPEFPGIYATYTAPNWDGWGETVYDPTLNWVIYLQGGLDEPLNYLLWDIRQKKTVALFQVSRELSAVPTWSPDGKLFALAPALFSTRSQYPVEELYVVDKGGSVSRLTHLTNYYPRVYIDNFNWSPDGNSIAFWFSSWQDTNGSYNTIANRYLAIVDTTTGWVTNTCINGENDASIGTRNYPAPLWSPDSKQIVVQSQTNENSFQTILIDVEQRRAFTIGVDLAPVGWMLKP